MVGFIETLIFGYIVGGAFCAVAFLLATWTHRDIGREYWECAAISFFLWPLVAIGEIVNSIRTHKRWRADRVRGKSAK